MSRENVYASTSLSSTYPSFISVNKLDGDRFEITVRSERSPDGSCGDQATIEISRHEFIKLALAAGVKFDTEPS